MSYFEAVILGIVQGLTEFLPISSSGHLRIVPELFGWGDPGASFTAVIQLGTMAAVVIYFWSDLWRITMAWFADAWRVGRSLVGRRKLPEGRSTDDARMGWYLIVATIPISIFGLAFKDQIENGARDLRLISATLIVGGLILLWADKVGKRTKEIEHVSTKDGVTIGVAQSLALVPGVSRSGATISAGLFLGFTREAAARFSFLLSIPAVVLSGVFSLKDVGTCSVGAGPTIVATVVSFVVGFAAIAWFLKFLTGHSFVPFVIYRVGLGVLLIVLLAAGTIDAKPTDACIAPSSSAAAAPAAPQH
ncbi:undecaprenyl-diphosphate phosphatase [Aquihabitans sp. McL0605]|uniref:undecaprenyl-diphosphate phosphatase n=1 Tax=Aquihabitans sp. McL0605 TaxID=3415671 RepID=UPI003CED5CC8